MTIAISAAYGLLFGSFLTVVVDRVPRGASIVAPGSECGNCGLRLGFLDLVPVFSWLALRGRCRRCRMSIGIEPLLLELLTGLVFGLLAWKFGLDWALPAYCVLAVGLIGLSIIDLHTKRLPRQIIYVTAAIGVPLLCVAALVRHEPRRMWMMLLGAGIAF
ncbi:MAG TPA: prepilin peptidase, partial [Ilumatobacteraceae bacterium]